MDTLPIELYGHICTFLGPSDLTNFARTSTACLGPARWHLYRNVVLRNDSPWLNEVCSLLEEVPGLKMRVTFLLVITVEDWAGSNDRIPWLHLNTFRGMKRLCSISFVHLPCKSPINLQKMMSGIYWECRELKQVSFSEISSDALPHYWSLPTTSMVYFAAFPKLEKVVYKSKPSSGEFLPPTRVNMLKNCSPQLGPLPPNIVRGFIFPHPS
jgi:hypothetical protein